MLRMQARPSSSESAAELDAAAREDLARLQRGYRVKEKERKTEGDQAQNSIRKQRCMIESLQSENADLKKNLSLAGSRQNELKSQLVRHKFDDLLSHQRQYMESVVEEEKAVEVLDQKIREMEREIALQRQLTGGVHGSQHQYVGLQKQLRVMENRLEKASVRFNSSLAVNAQMRTKIDHLRQEKAVFEGIHRKLQKELLSCKRAIGEVIEGSTHAYDARDDAQTKLISLKEKADKEVAQYEMEVKEYQRVIDHDRKLREFMSRKNQERTEAHLEMEARQLRKEAEKTSTRERTVMSYEQAFEKIKKATGITDIDQLVSKFIDVEDQNFALFNFVNELNAEIETMREQIQQVTEDIKRFKGQGVELEEKRRTILRDLEAELEKVEKERAEFERRFKISTATLDQLKTGVDSVFTKTGCDSSSITSLLGGHSGVTDSTILQYLGVVEQKTNELLQLQAFIQAKESGDPEVMTTFLMGHSGQRSPETTAITIPTITDDYDSDESDYGEVPLTQNELRDKVQRTMMRREAARKLAESTDPSHLSPSHPPPPSTALPGKTRGGTVDRKKRPIQTR